jgi:hypothetical protein
METQNKQHSQKVEKLIAETRFFKFLSVFFLGAAVIMAIFFYIFQAKDDIAHDKDRYPAPYNKEITRIMRDLHYSGKEMFSRPDVSLAINTPERLWILRNAYDYNEQGEVLLENGKYGTCGELSAYLAYKIRPMLGNEYHIRFVRTAYSAYFLGDFASHTVLKIYPKNLSMSDYVYIADPSFRRYGPISDFEDYFFYEEADKPAFAVSRDKNLVLPANQTIPLFVKGNYLIGFVVEDAMGVFDKDNFAVALVATRKYRYAGRYLFALRRYNGKEQHQENLALAKEILPEREYDVLKKRLIELFKNVRQTSK